MAGTVGFEPTDPFESSDFKSDAIGHSAKYPRTSIIFIMKIIHDRSRLRARIAAVKAVSEGLGPRPSDHGTDALPTELRAHCKQKHEKELDQGTFDRLHMTDFLLTHHG